MVSVALQKEISLSFLLPIEFRKGIYLEAIQHPKQMNKYSLPYPQLKFMQNINNKHKEKIEACMAEPFGEGILGVHELINSKLIV
jgi:hypothetical protein